MEVSSGGHVRNAIGIVVGRSATSLLAEGQVTYRAVGHFLWSPECNPPSCLSFGLMTGGLSSPPQLRTPGLSVKGRQDLRTQRTLGSWRYQGYLSKIAQALCAPVPTYLLPG